ncbi:glycosyltransferase family 2 protein [Paenibacillus sp. y28]|uniref:glycosyltransferase family 2 protein n=1 Tax=Paenibacillus sp. y28 TaxID=3129110 RepID=UPI00301912D6
MPHRGKIRRQRWAAKTAGNGLGRTAGAKAFIRRRGEIGNGRLAYRRTTPAEPVVSVIIPAKNERSTIAQVIAEAFRVHPYTEVIVVVNGSTDGTEQIARKAGANIISFPEPLGHDVGRSVGAREAKGQILLFTDGDIVIRSGHLAKLVQAIQSGTDVALNGYLGTVSKQDVHSVVLVKHVLNIALHRPDLLGASMTTIPHAISRRALQVIGTEHLSVPPLAMAMAIVHGLKVRRVHYIEVGTTNRKRGRGGKDGDPLEQLIVGDHLEALHWYLSASNARGFRTDLARQREAVK